MKVENIFLGALTFLAITAISMAAVGLGYKIGDATRKEQEREVCKKLGGRYDFFQECKAFDGGTIILPEVE